MLSPPSAQHECQYWIAVNFKECSVQECQHWIAVTFKSCSDRRVLNTSASSRLQTISKNAQSAECSTRVPACSCSQFQRRLSKPGAQHECQLAIAVNFKDGSVRGVLNTSASI
eukprot:6469100-Amphidinium_carterae.5